MIKITTNKKKENWIEDIEKSNKTDKIENLPITDLEDKELVEFVTGKPVQEGIRKDSDGKFVMDFTVDKIDDLLDLTKEEIYKSNFNGHIYRFGYTFKPDITSQNRSSVIKWIKGLSEEKPKKSDLRRFVNKPLATFNREISLTRIDAVIYPDSKRSDLVQQMVEISGNYLQHDIGSVGYKLIKNLPQNVEFDWVKFNQDISKDEDLNRHNQMKVTATQTMDKIKTKDYFSLAESVKSKYRPYIKNYLTFETEEAKKTFSELQGKKILIIDDINTTGATLNEILRVVGKVNDTCEIYIFTLIGKEWREV